MIGKSIRDAVTGVSRDMALWLEANYTNNRPEDRGEIARLAEKMRNGNYFPGPEVICIDSNGNVSNGWHTIQAILLLTSDPAYADTTVDVLVLNEVDPMARLYFDIGKKRTPTTFLQTEFGVQKNAHHEAAVLGACVALSTPTGNIKQTGLIHDGEELSAARHSFPNAARGVELALAFNQSVELRRWWQRGIKVLGTAYVAYAEDNPELAERAFRVLITGEGEESDRAFLELRERWATQTEDEWSRDRLAIHWDWFTQAWAEFTEAQRGRRFRLLG